LIRQNYTLINLSAVTFDSNAGNFSMEAYIFRSGYGQMLCVSFYSDGPISLLEKVVPNCLKK